MSSTTSSSITASNTMRADDLLVETVNGLLADQCTPERNAAAEGSFDHALFDQLEQSGLTLVGVPEANGGSGGTLHDSAAIAKALGYHAAATPAADTMLAASLASGLDVPSGPIALVLDRKNMAVIRAPWLPVAKHALIVNESGVSLVEAASVTVRDVTRSYAGEPVSLIDGNYLRAYQTATKSPVTPEGALYGAALNRSLLLAGALQRAVDLSLQYANEREQFGRPIGKFQILQHYLSEMAGEAVATDAAADNAIDLVASGSPKEECWLATAAAKAYAGRAVSTVTRLAHQLHGAIGYTDEHRLQYTTRRLWGWRDEYGSEAEWAAVLGLAVAKAGGAALWPRVTSWPPAS
jgi:acyl-CoA dehydrogenase